MGTSNDYITVGSITGPHGLKGEVKVFPRTDFPAERFAVKSSLQLRSPGQAPFREVTIRSSRKHKNLWLVLFDGFTTINDVEPWKGLELCVHKNDLIPLPEGTFYVHQLVGMTVVADDGREVGTLEQVLTPGANDVYMVRGPLQKREVLIPAIPECVLDVNLAKGTMTVHLLPGLLDEDEDS